DRSTATAVALARASQQLPQPPPLADRRHATQDNDRAAATAAATRRLPLAVPRRDTRTPAPAAQSWRFDSRAESTPAPRQQRPADRPIWCNRARVPPSLTTYESSRPTAAVRRRTSVPRRP